MWEPRELLNWVIDTEFIKAQFYMSRKISDQNKILESLLLSLIESIIFYSHSDLKCLDRLKEVFEYSEEWENIEYIIANQDCNKLDGLTDNYYFWIKVANINQRFDKSQIQTKLLLNFANFFNVSIIKFTFQAQIGWKISSYGNSKLSLYLYCKNSDYFILYPYYYTADGLKEKIFEEFYHHNKFHKFLYECICTPTKRLRSTCKCSETLAKLFKNDNGSSYKSSLPANTYDSLNYKANSFSFKNIEYDSEPKQVIKQESKGRIGEYFSSLSNIKKVYEEKGLFGAIKSYIPSYIPSNIPSYIPSYIPSLLWSKDKNEL